VRRQRDTGTEREEETRERRSNNEHAAEERLQAEELAQHLKLARAVVLPRLHPHEGETMGEGSARRHANRVAMGGRGAGADRSRRRGLRGSGELLF
jgi:hypothetical protein